MTGLLIAARMTGLLSTVNYNGDGIIHSIRSCLSRLVTNDHKTRVSYGEQVKHGTGPGSYNTR